MSFLALYPPRAQELSPRARSNIEFSGSRGMYIRMHCMSAGNRAVTNFDGLGIFVEPRAHSCPPAESPGIIQNRTINIEKSKSLISVPMRAAPARP